MVTLVPATDLQKLEFDVTTPMGSGRITVVTGRMLIAAQVTGDTVTAATNISVAALVEPRLTDVPI